MFFIMLSASSLGYGLWVIGDFNLSLGAVLIIQCTIKPNTLSRCLYDLSIYI